VLAQTVSLPKKLQGLKVAGKTAKAELCTRIDRVLNLRLAKLRKKINMHERHSTL
jgi:hypothetical protein